MRRESFEYWCKQRPEVGSAAGCHPAIRHAHDAGWDDGFEEGFKAGLDYLFSQLDYTKEMVETNMQVAKEATLKAEEEG